MYQSSCRNHGLNTATYECVGWLPIGAYLITFLYKIRRETRLYWNINEILSYQRNFNFINGPRSIGKTYTSLKYSIYNSIKHNKEFVYIVRTQDEKKNYILKKACEKVIHNEFYSYTFKHTHDKLLIGDTVIAHCIALSEAIKIKKESFPNVYNLIFDEYTLEEKYNSQYVNGWDEPELLLSIYHTIDRDEDRVKCFLLGNNTSFYNPYHLHPAFNIPFVPKGKIWCSENVLFQNALIPQNVKETKSKSKFSKMINNTDYGNYANDGTFYDTHNNFIQKLSNRSKCIGIIIIDKEKYGIWFNYTKNMIIISSKYDGCINEVYALTPNDMTNNSLLASKDFSLILLLSKYLRKSNVYYETKKIREKIARKIIKLI